MVNLAPKRSFPLREITHVVRVNLTLFPSFWFRYRWKTFLNLKKNCSTKHFNFFRFCPPMLLWFKKHFQLTRDIPKNLILLEDQCARMVPYGPIGSHMVPYGPRGSLRVPYSPIWSRKVLYGPVWSRWSCLFPYGLTYNGVCATFGAILHLFTQTQLHIFWT